MKRLVSLTAVGLSMVLLMPSGVGAQPPSDPVLEATDPVGDLVNASMQPVDGPAFVDLTGLLVSIEGDDLVVSFEVAGGWPKAARAYDGDVSYWLHVRTDDPDALGFDVRVFRWDGDWVAQVSGNSSSQSPRLDDPTVTDRGFTVRVPRPLGRAPEDLLFQAGSLGFPPGDGFEVDAMPIEVDQFEEVIGWMSRDYRDSLLDGPDEWLTFENVVVTWAEPPRPDLFAEPCEPPDPTFGLFETIETKVGKVAFEMVSLYDCPWNLDPGPMGDLLAPLGKDLGDMRVATAGVADTSGGGLGFASDMWAFRVAGVRPKALLESVLDTVMPGLTAVPALRTRKRRADGRTIWVMRTAHEHGCIVLASVTGEVLVVSPLSLGCDLGDLPAAQAVLGKHLDRVWRKGR